MLRPERMSRVSVIGSRRVVDDVIDTTHDLNLLHLSDYDGSWEGFEPGDPIEGADESSERLVTVRSLESILGVDSETGGPARIVDDEEASRELEAVRERVNDLDDRRDSLEDDRQGIDERLGTMEALSSLGIDLDLLGGYDTLRARIGEGDADAIDAALADAEGIESYEVFTGDEDDRVVAAFARPAADRSRNAGAETDGDDAEADTEANGETDAGDGAFEEALVGVEFAPITVPDAEGSPEEVASDLRERRDEIDADLEEVESELEEVREEKGDFLLATEEHLSIDVQKREVPLSFATTENAFVAEGWIPTERYVDLAEALQQSVGDHVEIDELERASYDGEGAVRDREPVEGGAGGTGEPTAADGSGEEVRTDGGPEAPGTNGRSDVGRADNGPNGERTDGGSAVERTDGGYGSEERPMAGRPPVVQDNPDSAKPFETLVRVLNRPQYSEFDPTFLVFLTFPLFFGFMIGDVGYGLLYLAIGYLIYSRYDGAIGALGAIGLWSGAFTVLFGVLYGEIFGLHTIGTVVWGGHPPIEKGLSPATLEYAQLWLVVSLLAGLLHVTAGYVLGFAKELQHSFRDALLESGSWALLMLGIWGWILSRALEASKPEFLFTVLNGEPFPFGFAGLPGTVGWAALAIGLLVGLPLMVYGEVTHLGNIGIIAGVLESLNVLVNVLSYARIAAVLLAKAGMAFVVNLLFFGAYQHDGEFSFLISHGPQWAVGEYGPEAVMFPGLIHMGIIGVLAGIVVVVVGHALVLVLGITSAGLQAVRLEYVEFFQKFYDGGGDDYEPFGRERRYTAEE
jgi:V/A-type H+-transporting ATPase subunit I